MGNKEKGKDRRLLWTNLWICLIIGIGFLVMTLFWGQYSYGQSEENVRSVSDLISENIFYQISGEFVEPVEVSLAMANDPLLRELLEQEAECLDDKAYINQISSYLAVYHEKYQFDSVFLVSAVTGRYYNFSGIDRIIEEENPENAWYYQALASEEEYILDVDNDEAGQAGNEITIFVDCKIRNEAGEVIAIAGVGVKVRKFQEIIRDYEERFRVNAVLVDKEGAIQVSTEHSGYENVSLFLEYGLEDKKEEIVSCKADGKGRSFWVSSERGGGGKSYVVVRYIPDLDWYLIVMQSANQYAKRIQVQFLKNLCIAIGIGVVIMFGVSVMVKGFHNQIVGLLQQRIDKEKEAKLQYVKKAQTDQMTGIYNKTATRYYVSQMLTTYPDKNFAFLIFDIDNFKQANDRFGHAFGDGVIMEFVQTVQYYLGPGCIFGRIGGDEFAALIPLPTVTTEEWAEEIAEELLGALKKTYTEGKNSWNMSASIGIALAPRDGKVFDELYKNADEALYVTKRSGKDGYAKAETID